MTDTPPVLLNRLGQQVTAALFPTNDGGAALYWQFGGFDSADPVFLLARLSDEEAQAVFDADWRVGMLEPVRAAMRDRAAGVGVGWDDPRVALIWIPGRGTEKDFARMLDRAARSASRRRWRILWSALLRRVPLWRAADVVGEESTMNAVRGRLAAA